MAQLIHIGWGVSEIRYGIDHTEQLDDEIDAVQRTKRVLHWSGDRLRQC
jgi:hypothetical protein